MLHLKGEELIRGWGETSKWKRRKRQSQNNWTKLCYLLSIFGQIFNNHKANKLQMKTHKANCSYLPIYLPFDVGIFDV